MWGQLGADRFGFGGGSGRDVIGDFEVGVDRLALSAMTAGALRSAAAFDPTHGAGVLITADADSVFLRGVRLDALCATAHIA